MNRLTLVGIIVAGLVICVDAQSEPSPPPTPAPSAAPQKHSASTDGDDGLSTGEIVGVVVGVIATVCMCGILITYYVVESPTTGGGFEYFAFDTKTGTLEPLASSQLTRMTADGYENVVGKQLKATDNGSLIDLTVSGAEQPSTRVDTQKYSENIRDLGISPMKIP